MRGQRFLLAALAGLSFYTVLHLYVVSQFQEQPQVLFEPAQNQGFLSNWNLPVRFEAHVDTDRARYRPGDTVFLRTWVTDAKNRSLVSLDCDCQLTCDWSACSSAYINILDGLGSSVFAAYDGLEILNSTIGYAYSIPEDAAGGQYVACIRHNEFIEACREFKVLLQAEPLLGAEVEWNQTSYEPGAVAVGVITGKNFKAASALKNAKYTATFSTNGVPFSVQEDKLNQYGKAIITVTLPRLPGEITLSVKLLYDGIMETKAFKVPVAFQQYELLVHSQSGYLLAGVVNTLAFESFLEGTGEPAEVVGHLRSLEGTKLADVRSEDFGRGSFSFEPSEGLTYTIELSNGQSIPLSLPVVSEGALISVKSQAIKFGEILSVDLLSKQSPKLRAYIKTTKVDLPSNTIISFEIPELESGGVIRLVAELDETPVAEALVFVLPSESLKVFVETSQPTFEPADSVTVTVHVTTQSGLPVSGAAVSLTATAASQETDWSLVESLLLEDEVSAKNNTLTATTYRNPLVGRGEYLKSYLKTGSCDDACKRRISLLMMTQDWRRLVFHRNDIWDYLYTISNEASSKVKKLLGYNDQVVYYSMSNNSMNDPTAADFEAADKGVAIPMAAHMADNIRFKGGFAREPDAIEDEFISGSQSLKSSGVREFFHGKRADWTAGVQEDFTQTVAWTSSHVTGPDGKFTYTFDLNDETTGLRILAQALNSKGFVGAGQTEIRSSLPLDFTVQMPSFCLKGDDLKAAVTVSNSYSLEMKATVSVSDSADKWELDLKPHSHSTGYLSIPSVKDTTVTFKLIAESGPKKISISKKLPLKVFERNFVHKTHFSGVIGSDELVFDYSSPDEHTSIDVECQVFFDTRATLMAALASFMHEPCGCFEQTSSTTFPLTMALHYFNSHITDETYQLIEFTTKLLKGGYTRLLSFESETGGFEWFGSSPGHEVLTAYGLLQFKEMVNAGFYEVNWEVTERTQKWLLSRMTEKGNFLQNSFAIDSFGYAPANVSDAYITWTLTEDSSLNMTHSLDYLIELAEQTEDPYFLALVSLGLINSNYKLEVAYKYLKLIESAQSSEGLVKGAQTSVTNSRFSDLDIETTALSTLAWIKAGGFETQVELGVKSLLRSSKSGSFGGTQATILALKAIIEYDKYKPAQPLSGEIQLFVDRTLADTYKLSNPNISNVKLTSKVSEIHQLHLKWIEADKQTYPYSCEVRTTTPKPPAESSVPIDLSVSLSKPECNRGDLIGLHAIIKNTETDKAGMTIARIGIPSCAELQTEELDRLVVNKKLASYELREGGELALYWRGLEGEQVIEVELSLICKFIGQCFGKSSSSYLYYGSEAKDWESSLELKTVEDSN
mmetsp:Transcript_3410/g.7075  ORF Transcript_3410/g.7075 Transcript_3410/m.7075 type:complete len:1354 (-) Transcript_3410:2663-6724(-)